MIVILNWIVFLFILVTTTGLLLYRDWRWSIGFLAIQYIGVFWLVQTHWSLSMAATKLVTGWMVCAILGIAKLNINPAQETEGFWPHGRLFRLFTGGIILASTFALSLRGSSWLGLSLPVTWSSLILCGMGLLQLGISSQPLRVIIGLLTILAGFEVLYASVESSTLVAALLSVVNLGLALIGAYFINPTLEEIS